MSFPGCPAPAGKSAAATFAEAETNTRAVSSVRIAGAGTEANKGVTFDLTLVRGKGCEGTVTMSKTQSFRLVYLGSTVWMKPSDAFYASLGSNKSALSLLEGKYIKVSVNSSLTPNIGELCTLSGLLGTAGPASGPGNGYAATTTTFRGQPAIKITQSGRPGYAYVSDTAKPLLLQVTEPGASGGSITFSRYNARDDHSPARRPNDRRQQARALISAAAARALRDVTGGQPARSGASESRLDNSLREMAPSCGYAGIVQYRVWTLDPNAP